MSKLDRLQEAARALAQESVPGAADARLHGRLTEPRRKRIPFAIGLSLVSAAAVAVVFVMWPRDEGFAVREGCVGAAVEGASVTAGSSACEIEIARATIALSQGTHVKRTPTGVQVTHGRARFSVAPRKASEPSFEVRVSQGVIRVIGTRFTVDEKGSTGHVQLEEGRITFTREGGSVVAMRAGEGLDWPVAEPVPPGTPDIPAPPARPPSIQPPVAPEPPVTREAPKAPPRVAPKAAEDDLFERLESLRTQARYQEAVTMLREALAGNHRAKVKRRLSYELGSLLTHQLRDHDAACAHWATHVKAYPDDEGARSARLALACGD